MKIVVDMNLSPRWAKFLADAGYEAVHWSQVGPGDASDQDLMGWAAEQDHVVLIKRLGLGGDSGRDTQSKAERRAIAR